MKRRHRLLLGKTSLCASFVLVAFLAWPACSCLPIGYRELATAEVPSEYVLIAAKSAPGLELTRAWSYGFGREVDRGKIRGYSLRFGSANGWRRRDIKVPKAERPGDDDTIDLKPINLD